MMHHVSSSVISGISGTSRPRVRQGWFANLGGGRRGLVAGLLAVAVVLAASSAEAKKKKSSGELEGQTEEGGGDSKEAKSADAPGAAQASDQERPKPTLEEGDDSSAPKADQEGNVNFTGRQGAGSIKVKAPKDEKLKIYLEGKYFGRAPRTIKKVPPGDYILEAVYPDGKSVTKPVSVIGDGEVVVDMGGEAAAPEATVEKPMDPEKAEKRFQMAKYIGIGAIVALAAGVGFGVWEKSVQSSYDDKLANPPAPATSEYQQELNDLAKKGDRLALAANVCWIVAGVGVVAAVIIGYPAYKARQNAEQHPPEAIPLSFMLAPTSAGGGMAGVSLRF